jgi:hypothetical protein
LLDLRAERKVTWRKFRLEHVHRDDVDDEYPDGTVQQLRFAPHECHSAKTLALQPAPVGVCSPQLSVNVLLKFLHVEQLQHKRDVNFSVSSSFEGEVTGYIHRGPGFDSPALPDILRNTGSGPGSTQPREDK